VGAAVHLATVHFIMINVVLAACWVVVVVFLSRQYAKHREAGPTGPTAPVRLAEA